MGQIADVPRMLRRGELLFASALIGILVVLILPLHKTILDIALACSLAFSIVVLMTVLFLEDPLQFSVFPTVLLVSTMLRLALNVASTRLILSEGHHGTAAAGSIIKAFGSFVMGGNFFIGLIVFAILVVINFVVITKGSGRIAEVVARFSLDALPGKQMSVDADLSSGAIDQVEAKRRRQHIQDEINFYGAMDGAAKFVRGDAMAGLLITAINLIGGIIVGVLQQSMSVSSAADTYALLTVGDGLVSQIPALIVSVASGMLISKTSSKGTTDKAFIGQMGAYPAALGMSGVLLSIFAFLPGMPWGPFLFMAGAAGFMAFRLGAQTSQAKAIEQSGKAQPKPGEEVAESEEKTPEDMLAMDELKLELGVGLVSMIKKPEALIARIRSVRESLARTFGIVVPTIRIVDNLMLETYSYALKVKEIQACSGRILPNKVMALDPSGTLQKLTGEAGQEPVLGIQGVWIDDSQSKEAKEKGYVIAEPKALLATHLTETLKAHLPDLLSFSLQQQMVDGLRKPEQKLYGDMVPMQISAASFGRILKNLLKERVSIRDLGTIVEATSEGLTQTKEPSMLTERVRTTLARQLVAPFASKSGVVSLVSLGPEWSRNFQSALTNSEGKFTGVLAMAPSQLSAFYTALTKVYDKPEVKGLGQVVPLLTSSTQRPFVRTAIEKVRPDLPVFSDTEATAYYKVDIVSELG